MQIYSVEPTDINILHSRESRYIGNTEQSVNLYETTCKILARDLWQF